MEAYTGLKSDFIERTSRAYNRFQREKIPFSALRLGISGAEAKNLDVDQVVGRHLRKTDEIVSQGDNSYAILMQGTSFDAALAASERLANGLLNLKKAKVTTASKHQWNASFDIIGCRKESQDICRTCLKLTSNLEETQEKKEIPKPIQTYIQNSKLLAGQTGNSGPSVNIIV